MTKARRAVRTRGAMAWFGALVATCLGLSACGGAHGAAGAPAAPAKAPVKAGHLATIDIQIPNFDIDHVPLQIAEAKGFYARGGVSVKLDRLSVPAAVAALLNGQVKFISVSSAAMQAAWKGAAVRMVAAIDVRPQYALVARPGIRSPAGLKGKSISSITNADTLVQMTSLALPHFGIAPTDVTFVGLGADPSQVAGLLSGTVSASILAPGYSNEAEQKGMHALFVLGDVVHVPLAGLATTTAFIRQHPSEVRAVVRGTVEGMAFMKAHPRQAQAFIAREFHYSSATARAVYASGIRGYAYGGRLSPAEMQRVLAMGAAFAKKAGARGGQAEPPVPAVLSKADVARLADLQFLPAVANGG